jgi:geranylgeranyl diphosphate synthase type II
MLHPHAIKFATLVEEEISSCGFSTLMPENLYRPAAYAMRPGGKRLRPILLMAACEMYGGDVDRSARQAAAIEIFHNFTLIHDDIIDHADTRRGDASVYKQFGLRSAILSGDLMMIQMYRLLADCAPEVMTSVLDAFHHMAILLCEGQQDDIDFASAGVITIPSYIRMIECKTSVLLGACLQIGGILGNAPEKDIHHLYRFGLEIGTAFQMQDDWLDCFGDPEETGKISGGDIIQGKKSLPVLLLADQVTSSEKETLKRLLSDRSPDSVKPVLDLMYKYGVEKLSAEMTRKQYQEAISHIGHLNVGKEQKYFLSEFGRYLIERKR